VFVLGKPLQPSLMFAVKAGAKIILWAMAVDGQNFKKYVGVFFTSQHYFFSLRSLRKAVDG